MTTQLKICGVTRPQDFDVCEELGVDAVGLNLWAGSRRALGLDEARSLLGARERGPIRVGVFVDPEPEFLARALGELDLDFVQMHGDAALEAYAPMPRPYVWVLRGTPELATQSLPTPPPAWILLDSAVAGYGGAGRTTDWEWAGRAVSHFGPVPVWLAGGIDDRNASQAMAAVRPAGLDVASGAELPGALRGEKDAERIASLVRICHNTDSP